MTLSALVSSETRATVGSQATALQPPVHTRGHVRTFSQKLPLQSLVRIVFAVGGGAHVLSGQGQLLEGSDCFDAQALACHARNIKVVDTSLLGCFCDV